MKQCIGTDIIEINRVNNAIKRWGSRFLKRIFTEKELTIYHNKPSSLAARFAGKEAVIKALAPQISRFSWKEIEILAGPGGKPGVKLYGKAQKQAVSLGLNSLDISLSHCREYAIAFVAGIIK